MIRRVKFSNSLTIFSHKINERSDYCYCKYRFMCLKSLFIGNNATLCYVTTCFVCRKLLHRLLLTSLIFVTFNQHIFWMWPFSMQTICWRIDVIIWSLFCAQQDKRIKNNDDIYNIKSNENGKCTFLHFNALKELTPIY